MAAGTGNAPAGQEWGKEKQLANQGKRSTHEVHEGKSTNS